MTAGTLRATLQHVMATDDRHVVGVHRTTAEREGKQLDVACCILFEVENDQIIDGREYFYNLHAWDGFWS
jgi:ketosteroid isomerase-like protein